MIDCVKREYRNDKKWANYADFLKRFGYKMQMMLFRIILLKRFSKLERKRKITLL